MDEESAQQRKGAEGADSSDGRASTLQREGMDLSERSGLKGKLTLLRQAVVERWEIPSDIMAELPRRLRNIVCQLDDDGQPLPPDKQYDDRQLNRAGRLLNALAQTNNQAAALELQGAIAGERLLPPDDPGTVDGEVSPVQTYRIELPDNGRDGE